MKVKKSVVFAAALACGILLGLNVAYNVVITEAWREQVQGGTVSGQRPRDGGLGGTRPAAGSRG